MSEEPPTQQELPGRLDRDDKSAKWNRDWEIHADQGIGEPPDETEENSVRAARRVLDLSEIDKKDEYIPVSTQKAKENAEKVQQMFRDKDAEKSKQ